MRQSVPKRTLVLSTNILARGRPMPEQSARSGRQATSISGSGPSGKSTARQDHKPTVSLSVKSTNESAKSDCIAEGTIREGAYSLHNRSLCHSIPIVPRVHSATHAVGAYSLHSGSLPFLQSIVSRNHSETSGPRTYSRCSPVAELP